MTFKKGQTPPGAKPFQPGQTGNPNGRPRKLPDLDKLLESVLGKESKRGGEYITEAELILLALARKAKKGDVRASEVLLERGYGKPKQDVEQKTIIYSVDVTDEEAKAIALSILKDI